MDITTTEPLTIPEPPGRPEVPEVGELRTPDDLPPLHRQLVAQAEALAGRAGDARIGQSESDQWTDAARRVNQLWEAWRHRMHATEEHEAMRATATSAVHALIEGLRGGEWREAHRWFDVADGWIRQLNMLAEYQPLLWPQASPRGRVRPLAAVLLGRRR
jgi:hypothetical protein